MRSIHSTTFFFFFFENYYLQCFVVIFFLKEARSSFLPNIKHFLLLQNKELIRSYFKPTIALVILTDDMHFTHISSNMGPFTALATISYFSSTRSIAILFPFSQRRDHKLVINSRTFTQGNDNTQTKDNNN